MLDLQGLIVEVLDAPPVSLDAGVTVRARVRMLCSCATEPGGLWTVERVTAATRPISVGAPSGM